MKSLVLLSGGPDSATALYWEKNSGSEVETLSLKVEIEGAVINGYNKPELGAAVLLSRGLDVPHKSIDLRSVSSLLEDVPDMVFAVGGDMNNCCSREYTTAPLGVEVMHMVALMYAVSHGFSKIVWGVNRDDYKSNEDMENAIKYLSLMGDIVSLRTGKDCPIYAPFIKTPKHEVISYGRQLRVPFRHTFSCSVSDSIYHCGKCSQCLRRRKAFEKARVTDPAIYHDSDEDHNFLRRSKEMKDEVRRRTAP